MQFSHCYVKERTKEKATVRVIFCHEIDQSKIPVEEEHDNDLHPTVVGDDDPETYRYIKGSKGDEKDMYELIGGAEVLVILQ